MDIRTVNKVVYKGVEIPLPTPVSVDLDRIERAYGNYLDLTLDLIREAILLKVEEIKNE